MWCLNFCKIIEFLDEKFNLMDFLTFSSFPEGSQEKNKHFKL